LAVWRYCAASAAYLFGNSTGNDKADRILELALDSTTEDGAAKWIPRRELYNEFGHNIKKAELDYAIQLQMERGMIEEGKQKPPKGKGRPRAVIRATEAAFEQHRLSS
jgi:hypothetical protein